VTPMSDQERVFDKTAGENLAWSPDLWFFEYFQGKAAYGLRVKRQLHREKSEFQDISVYDTYMHGRLLVIDGLVMLTEKDEFVYHEMIAHVPMQTLPEAKHAGVIGGGDGGTVRELAKYDRLEKITLCEIDRRVVEVSREYLPFVADSFSDPRVELKFEDGAKWVKQLDPGSMDLIIVDSTDPIGPGEVLFSEEFYKNAARALSEDGVLTAQTETPLYHGAVIKDIYRNLAAAFNNTFMYWACIPSYLGNLWTFCYASKSKHPTKDHSPAMLDKLGCRCYTEEMHRAAFAPPRFALECLPGGHPQRQGPI